VLSQLYHVHVVLQYCKAIKDYLFLMLCFPIVNFIQELSDKTTDIMVDMHLTHSDKLNSII